MRLYEQTRHYFSALCIHVMEHNLADSDLVAVLLGFVVFGGVFFEVLQRIFWR
jgi:hypothetical protein